MRLRAHLPLVLIVVAALVLGARHLTNEHLWGDDFAAYILQARAVSTGTVAAEVAASTFTVEHSTSAGWPPIYPWGFPLLLAPVAAATTEIQALKVPGLLLFAGFLVAFAALMFRRLPPAEALLTVAALGFNPGLLGFLDQVLSDIPFMGLATVAILLMDPSRAPPRRRILHAVGLGAIIATAYLFRTLGILLLGAWLLHGALLAWERRTDRVERLRHVQELAVTTATTLLLILFAGLALPDGEGGGYGSLLQGTSPGMVASNLVEYAGMFREFFAGVPGGHVLYLGFLPMVALGLWRANQIDRPLLLHAGLTLAVLVVWPFQQGPRFIFPLLPFFAYLAMHGTRSGVGSLPLPWRSAGHRAMQAAWFLLVAVFAVQATRRAGMIVETGPAGGPFRPASAELFEFLRNETAPEAEVIFFKPRAARLLTGRRALRGTDCEVLASGQVLVLAKGDEPFQLSSAALEACAATLERRFENASFVVHHIASVGSPGVPPDG